MTLKKIKNYNNYAIDKNGNVYNTKRNRILAPRINKDGYNGVYLYQDGKGTNYRVHRLVAEAFIPNPNDYKEVNHKDHNTLNNCVDNLEWCDRTYNNRYSRAKKIKQLTKDNKLIKIWNCMRDVERSLNINHSCISNCCMGKQKTAGGFKWEYL
jgi:hypothetical protein